MQRNRDEFIRQLWTAGFEFKEQLPHADLFTRLADGAKVLVPRREYVGVKWANARLRGEPETLVHSQYPSPCCNGESVVRRVLGGAMYLRCRVCTRLWERPAAQRPVLRVVEPG
jgi:hypothetical protein